MAKLSASSLLELVFVSSPSIQPGGARALAVHTHVHVPDQSEDGSSDAPEYHSQVYLYTLASDEAPMQLTHNGTRNMAPAFSPDGSQIAFLSNRESDAIQLCVMSVSGGEAKVITQFERGVNSFVWHPDSEHIALVSRGDTLEPPVDSPKVVTNKRYKWDGQGLLPEVDTTIYLANLAKGSVDALVKPSADPAQLTFSEDGKSLYYIAAADAAAEDIWQKSVWRVSLAKKSRKEVISGVLVQTITLTAGEDDLYYTAPSEPGNFASPTGLWHVAFSKSPKKRQVRCISGELEVAPSVGGDSSYGNYPNTPTHVDGGLLINLNRAGHSGLSLVDMDDGSITNWHAPDETRAVTAFAADESSGRVVMTIEHPDQPAELYLRESSGNERQLSHVNADFVKRYKPLMPSDVQHTRADGSEVDVPYWVLSPQKARDDEAMIVQVHGGPHANYGYRFMFEFQFLVAQGYTVVYGNPRGGSSYGHDFATAGLGGYGTHDADDVLAITNAAKAAHSTPDAPVHLTGGSYGGFMTNWLTSHTDMFRSAVTQRSICNWLSFYGSSDIGYHFAAREVAGNPWDDTDKLWQQSPLRYVANVKTPTLVIHAEEDHRCPIEQAEQWFIALRQLGVDTKFIRYPDEGHELSRSGRPDRRIHRLEAIVDWFKQHA